MRYRISRVSNYSGDRQPCSNAIKERIDEYSTHLNKWVREYPKRIAKYEKDLE